MPFLHFLACTIDSCRNFSHRLSRNSKISNQPMHPGPGSFEVSSISVSNVDENARSCSPSPTQSIDSIQKQENEGERSDLGPHSTPRITRAEPFLNEKMCELVGYGVNLGFLAGVHPFQWNNSEPKIMRISQKYYNLSWWIGIWLFAVYSLFLMFQFIDRFTSYEELDLEKLLLLYTIAMMLLPLVFQIVSIIHRDLLVGFANQSVRFCHDYAQLFDTDLRKTKAAELKIAIIFLQLVYFGLVLLLLLVACIGIAKPDLCVLPSSLCQDPDSSCHIPMQVISVVFLIALDVVYVAGSALYAAGLALVLCMSTTLWHLNVLHAKRDLYGPRNLIHLYKQLYLLFEQLNQLISMPLLPAMENTMVTLTVFGLYAALRTSGVLSMLMFAVACVAFTCIILLFWALAKIHSASLEVLETWKRDLRFSEMELASMRPIRIRLASYGYVDAGIMITIIEVIFNNAITLLITM